MAEDKKDPEKYEIGHCKPPKKNQFQPGKSGNPTGRPKGRKNLATLFREEGDKKVRIPGPKGRMVTKTQAVVMQLTNKALRGELPATREYLSHCRFHEESAESKEVPSTPHERDLAVMASMLKRFATVTVQTASDTEPEEE